MVWGGGERDGIELVVVVQLPDLELGGLRAEPELLDEGEIVVVRFLIRNSGAAEARNAIIRLYDNGKRIKEWCVEALGPAETMELSASLRLGVGNHQLSVQALMADRELSLSNNEAHGEARVRAAGLAPGPGALSAIVAAAAGILIAQRRRGCDR